ncbi:hypothetical protein ESCOMM109M1_04910 [Escherichia coli]
MSPFWRLITAIVTAPVMWLKDVLVLTVLANMFVATASGSMLRLLAWAVNVTAKPASAAQGVIRFFKENAKAVVTVNAGTVRVASSNSAQTHLGATNSAGAHTHSVSGTAASAGEHKHTVGIGAHTHSVAIGSHGHTITVNAAGTSENTVKNIALNYIVRLA